MSLTEHLSLKGLILIRPQVFEDNRGYFFESYNEEKMLGGSFNETFVQDNESLSNAGVLRGLHFQNPPYAQGKLVRVVAGAVMDVVVDIRKSSASYMKHYSVELSDENKLMLYIPPGFAHGFEVTSASAEFLYKTTDYWYPEHERSLLWNDPQLGVPWPLSGAPILAAKDAAGKPLSEAETYP